MFEGKTLIPNTACPLGNFPTGIKTKYTSGELRWLGFYCGEAFTDEKTYLNFVPHPEQLIDQHVLSPADLARVQAMGEANSLTQKLQDLATAKAFVTVQGQWVGCDQKQGFLRLKDSCVKRPELAYDKAPKNSLSELQGSLPGSMADHYYYPYARLTLSEFMGDPSAAVPPGSTSGQVMLLCPPKHWFAGFEEVLMDKAGVVRRLKGLCAQPNLSNLQAPLSPKPMNFYVGTHPGGTGMTQGRLSCSQYTPLATLSGITSWGGLFYGLSLKTCAFAAELPVVGLKAPKDDLKETTLSCPEDHGVVGVYVTYSDRIQALSLICGVSPPEL
jgi:hypothetical protein